MAEQRIERRRRRRGWVVALTGVHGVNGAALLRRLDADERVTHLVLLDVRPPAIPLRKAVLNRIDLTAPLADVALAEVLVREHVDTVIHAAFEGSPVSQVEAAHELEVLGTRALLRALAHNLRHDDTVANLVVLGTTMSYGAYPDNPQYLTEAMPLRGAGAYAFVADKVAVEGEVARFRARTGLPTAMVRAAWTVGDDRTLTARLLAGLAVPTVLGTDPLVQLLHLDDLVDAVCLIARARHDGPFNVAGRGVLPLSTIIKLAGRLRVALPDPALRAALQTLWSLGVGFVPGAHVRYLRDTCVADIARIEGVLGWRPRYGTRAALAQHVAARWTRGRLAA